MSQGPEDFSFFVYASLNKGDAVPKPTSKYRAEATIRKASSGNSETIAMRAMMTFVGLQL